MWVERGHWSEIKPKPIQQHHTAYLPYPCANPIHAPGNWVGIHRKPLNLMKNLLETRRSSDISPDVSIINNIAEQEMVGLRCFFCCLGCVGRWGLGGLGLARTRIGR